MYIGLYYVCMDYVFNYYVWKYVYVRMNGLGI